MTSLDCCYIATTLYLHIISIFSLSPLFEFFSKVVGNNMEALATRLQNAASVVVALNSSKRIHCNDHQGNDDDSSIEDKKESRNTQCIDGILESLVRIFLEFYLRKVQSIFLGLAETGISWDNLDHFDKEKKDTLLLQR